jgi:hypothetical protein
MTEEQKQINSFDDLVFGQHRNRQKGAVQAQHTLPNNIVVSVVGGGQGLYGNGIDSFEVGAWTTDNGNWIKLSEHDDVVGWQTKEEVSAIIQKLKNME